MNLLKTIIERLNQRVEVANIFDKQFNLCELNANGNDKAWVHYIGNGQAEVVTNFDAKNGTLFWAKRGKVTVAKTDAYRMSGCKQLYVTSFPLTAYAIVRKSHLPCDAEDAQDWLASRVYKLTSGTDPLFKQSIGVINYEVVPSGYTNEIKTLTANYEWACVSVDMDVQVITTSEDGCYDTCQTGDIPLPDLPVCTPCLTEVAVDGITITGDGTPANPLVAVGGGGGAISVEDEGDEVTPIATTLNFTGAGVTASLTSPGVVEVNVPGGGTGDVGTLQEVTDLGNSTTNDIAFTASAGLSFDNGAFFRKGTTDAGNGGAKGTSQICSISYELKWEAGRLYYMQQDGFTIRDVTHNFTFVPQPTDDSSKGFVVGSRWSLDDGTVYLCSDDTIGAAVWAVVAVGTVTDVTATAPLSSSGGTTPDISITKADSTTDGYLSSADWNTFDGKFDVPTGLSTDYLDGLGTPTPFPTIPPAQVNSDWNATSGVAEILNKPTIPVVTGFVPYTGATTDLNMGTHNVTADHIALNVNPSGAGFVEGATEWNNTIGSSQTLLKGGNVTLKNGVDLVARIVNKVTPNTTLTKAAYQAVRVSGATGGRLSVELARGDVDANSADTIGLVCETINTNQEGFIITVGQLLDINTTGSLQGETWADGDVLYLSPTTAGRLTNVKPNGSTGHIVVIGYVEYAHVSNGAIYVKVMNGWELDELHNVFISSPANNDALIYESSTQLWKNKTIATALGYTPVPSTRSITINGTTQDLSADRTFTIAAPLIYRSALDTAGYSSAANTAVYTQLIPANTFVAGDIIRTTFRTRKTGGSNAQTIRIYVNATADLTGTPILVGQYTIVAATGFYNQMQRHLAIKNTTTNTEVIATSVSSLATDFGNLTAAPSTLAINWTANRHFVFAIQSGGAIDVNFGSMYLIEKL